VSVKVRDDPKLISGAINAFPRDYQVGYSKCRAIGRRYLAEAAPADDLVAELAASVQCTLREWRAGRRKAAELQSDAEFSNTLRDSGIHSRLAALARISLPELGIAEKNRYLSGKPAAQAALAAFDSNLLTILRALGDRLFVGNTNVTFPMKAVLLITGFMPALDSRVRMGLQRSGLSGTNKTQYLLRDDPTHPDCKRITRLPFLLGQCWRNCTPQVQEGVANSDFPDLREDPGRVFDILLFMQAAKDNPILVISDPPDRDWYKLP
jgi:hypothetical protein